MTVSEFIETNLNQTETPYDFPYIEFQIQTDPTKEYYEQYIRIAGEPDDWEAVKKQVGQLEVKTWRACFDQHDECRICFYITATVPENKQACWTFTAPAATPSTATTTPTEKCRECALPDSKYTVSAPAIFQFSMEAAQAENFQQNLYQIRDEQDNRWVQCAECGKIATDEEFVSYGGPNEVNLGQCRDCYEKKHPHQKPPMQSVNWHNIL